MSKVGPADTKTTHDSPVADRAKYAPPNTPTSIFATPPAIKELFSKFPLRTYAANELPYRARRQKDDNVLYVFTTESGARMDSPSFNPGCLKWQTYLKFLDVPFHTAPSSNHASPTGSLPFLLSARSCAAIPSSKLDSWLKEKHAKETQDLSIQYQLHASLLSQPIRLAYLHALYLDEEAFKTVTAPLYIDPNSSHILVRASLGPSLRAAALDQLLASRSTFNSTSSIDLEGLYKDAEDAFEALSNLLGEKDWYSQTENSTKEEQQPGLLDASVFAYTHVVLRLFASLSVGSPGERLRTSITRCSNILEHHDRIARQYFHAPR